MPLEPRNPNPQVDAWLENFAKWTRGPEGLDSADSIGSLRSFTMALGPQPSLNDEPARRESAVAGAHAFLSLLEGYPEALAKESEFPLIDFDKLSKLSPRKKDPLDAVGDCYQVLGMAIAATWLSPGHGIETLLAITRVTFGLDPIAAMLRRFVLRGKPFAPDDNPKLPKIAGVSLDQIDRAIFYGTIRQYFVSIACNGENQSNLIAWMQSGDAETPTRKITSVSPVRVCPGGELEIRGIGFGTPPFGSPAPALHEVLVPGQNGRCIIVPDANIVVWWDDLVKIRLPAEATSGCVGFRVFRDDAPVGAVCMSPTDAAAGLQILGEINRAREVFWTGMGQSLSVVGGRLANLNVQQFGNCPPCLPADGNGIIPNAITILIPVIRAFTINGSIDARIAPGDTISFVWQTENVDRIEINRTLIGAGDPSPYEPGTARRDISAADPNFPETQAMAAVPDFSVGPLPLQVNTIPQVVEWDLSDDWDFEYELRAFNRCSGTGNPVIALARLRMRQSANDIFGLADLHAHLVAEEGIGRLAMWGTMKGAGIADALPSSDGANGGPEVSVFGRFAGLEGPTQEVGGGYPDFRVWPKWNHVGYQKTYIDWLKRAHDGGLRIAVCLANNSEHGARAFLRVLEFAGAEKFCGKDIPTDRAEIDKLISDEDAIKRQIHGIKNIVGAVEAETGVAPGQAWLAVATSPGEAAAIARSGRLALILGVEVGSLFGGYAKVDGQGNPIDSLAVLAAADGQSVEAYIEAKVQDLYDLGIRYVFPVHGIDNAYGGTALFTRVYDAANWRINGGHFAVEQADSSLEIAYRIDQDFMTKPPEWNDAGLQKSVYQRLEYMLAYHDPKAVLEAFSAAAGATAIAALLALLTGAPIVAGLNAGLLALGAAVGIIELAFPVPPGKPNWSGVRGGHINARDLTDHGRKLLRALMRRGMMIDVDHMGHKTMNSALQFLNTHKYPACAGHAHFRDLKFGGTAAALGLEFDGTNAMAILFGTAHTKRLSTERDLTAAHLKSIRHGGGMVAPMLFQMDGPECKCVPSGAWMMHFGVANDCMGSSKSFAQSLEYATYHMRGRRVGFGSDINGGIAQPAPRFGPAAAGGSGLPQGHETSETLDAVSQYVTYRRDPSLPPLLPMAPATPLKRRDQAFAQASGVVYADAITENRFERFRQVNVGDPNHHPGPPFDREERDFWQALIVWESGLQPADAARADLLPDRSLLDQTLLIDMGMGLRWPNRKPDPDPLNAGLLIANYDFQLASYLAKNELAPSPGDSQNVVRLAAKFARIWAHYKAMRPARPLLEPKPWLTGAGAALQNIYDGDGRMIRSTAGDLGLAFGGKPRDFDINVDGMAHYGMLPDFMQDLRNAGVSVTGMQALYRAAGDLLRVWRLCERRMNAIP